MADLKKEIEALHKAFNGYFKNKNFKAMAEIYTKNGRSMPPGKPDVVGRDALEEYFARYATYGGELKGTVEEVIAFDENQAIMRGPYSLVNEDGMVAVSGKHVILYKREDGKLRCVWDIWNIDEH